MTKIDALCRFLLPCIQPTSTSSTPSPPIIKKRISTSLRDDLDDIATSTTKQEDQQNQDPTSDPTTPTTSTNTLLLAPPRPSKTMVIGTIFGHRHGTHIWFCVQHDRLNTRPALLLQLSIPTLTLIQEMGQGLVRIALEFKPDTNTTNPDLSRCHLHSIPVWTLFCNGRKLGFAVKRKANENTRLMLKTMQNITVGAGVIPSGSGFGSEELTYMRANYECMIGSADSESFHLINPDDGPGQELSIFLLRST